MVGDILQPTHLLFVLVVALLVLGPKRLPEVSRQLGNGIRDFRAAINGERQDPPDEVPSRHAAPNPEGAAPAMPSQHSFAHDASVGADAPEFADETPTGAAHAPAFADEPSNGAADAPAFADETPNGGAADAPAFDEPSVGSSQEHTFAHQAAEPSPDQHQFAGSDGATADSLGEPAEHQFAHGQSESPPAPADPHS